MTAFIWRPCVIALIDDGHGPTNPLLVIVPPDNDQNRLLDDLRKWVAREGWSFLETFADEDAFSAYLGGPNPLTPADLAALMNVATLQATPLNYRVFVYSVVITNANADPQRCYQWPI